jgi:hypothetical protein
MTEIRVIESDEDRSISKIALIDEDGWEFWRGTPEELSDLRVAK